jgi:benzoyl-CoA 2,3-dioxygenase component B
VPVTPEGKMVSREEYDKRLYEWIPSEADKAFVRSLMQRVAEPGKMAGWVAPPERGINNLPVEYEYVKLS